MIYAVVAPATLWVAVRHSSWVLSRLSEQDSWYLLLLTFVVLVAIFAIVYPKANVHIAGRGSDADDGLNLAVNELLKGRYPYHARTYLDNPISPLPGAIVLATPFVLLGSSAYQNLFWLGVFCFVLFRMMQSWRGTLILFGTVLIFSPVVMNHVVTGGDYPTNTIYVLGFMLLTLSWGSRADAPSWKKLLPVLLLGIGLSSRANFLLLMPQLFSALTLRAGWRAATRYSALALVVCAAVTIPFWIYDPAGFTPLHTQAHKVAEFQEVLPFASLVVPALGGCIALALAWSSIRRRKETWLRDCAIVQAFLVVCVVTLAVIQTGTLSLIETSYGVFFLFFGVMALGPKMIGMSDAQRNAATL
ncbi:MAG TPA: hypothetical protein VLQ90_08540 [Pyrinomonadaceae bacterium]|nr:hypothetical protein [Pyrinomonadaceae bacterium]